MYGRVVTVFAVAGLLTGSGVGSAQATGPVASTAGIPATTVHAEPADSPGENPFTSSVAGAVLDVAVARSSGAVSGGEPGLGMPSYGPGRELEPPPRSAPFTAMTDTAI